MQAAHSQARQDKVPRSNGERTCLATGETLPKESLIRFVASPDSTVVPDLAQNLPGRGLWVKADRAAITLAARKGLFSKAAKESLKADPDLADQVAVLLRKRALEFLGLARGAGLAVLGQPQVEAALKAGKLGLLLLADDASQTLDNRRGIGEIHSLTRNELGAAFGHDQIVYAGLKPHALTDRIKSVLALLEKLASPDHISQGNGTNPT